MSYSQFNLQPVLKPIDNLFLDRLRQFVDGGRYKELNLPKFYDLARVDSSTDAIDLKVWRVPDVDGKTARPLFRDIEFDKIEWKEAKKGDNFGPSWKTFWFKIEWQIPTEWLAQGEIDFDWDCSNEGLIYDHSGSPLQAFTGGERTIFNLPERFKKKGKQLFYLEIACNGMFGNGDGGNPDPNRSFRLNRCDLLLPDVEARKLFWDFWIIGDAARELGLGPQKYQAASVATRIMDTFDANDRKSISKCRKIAKTFLGPDIDSDAVYHTNPLNIIDVHAVGNCHIDTAWLWPFAETRRKIVRSWTTQLKLADDYPEYIFVASQMQQFKWLKQDHPEVLKLIKEKFVTNQFLPIGGSWVENDTNMPGGESLIRQFLLGQRAMLDEFGVQATIYWLPDTFGYSSQIPQICQTVGIEKFLTQKLSWNNINQFPLSTFNWKAIDGSQVLVHMPPANTYTASANFGDVVRSLHQHKNLRDVPSGLLLYGHGDGGGGPSEEMLEKLRRCRGLSNTLAAIPSVHVGNTVEDFYEEILEKSDNGSTLPTWTGEIYLEFHRGTYTTQADVKKWMRLCEIRLHDLEFLATIISIKHKDYTYPTKEIHDLWEDVALCQFHDVLPGSCIGMVYYDEVKPMLTKTLKSLDRLTKEALDRLASEDHLKEVAAVNTLPWHRIELVKFEKEEVAAFDNSISCLETELYNTVAFSTKTSQFLRKADIKYPASISEKEGRYTLTNKLLQAEILSDGTVSSLVDLITGREIIDSTETKQTNGRGNQFVLFDDEPLNFPAWDTEVFSLNKFSFLEGGEVVDVVDHPLESKLVVKHKISDKSYIESTITLQGLTDNTIIAQNNFLKFSCHVEWHEFYKFLKVQFPTSIRTPQYALFETQFGITQRPTHYNTSWDVAKFEVCHHKFMDLSEFNYGVSVFNDSKYGASVHGNLMRLSLLRSAKAPDDKADMGTHDFSYALYPHHGALGPDVVRLAHNFNYGLLKAPGVLKSLELITGAITLSGDKSLVLSNIKRGEDDKDINVYENIESLAEKSAVLRVYESLGGLAHGTIEFHGLAVKKVFRANALEELQEELHVKDEQVKITLRAFEIATYKVIFQ